MKKILFFILIFLGIISNDIDNRENVANKKYQNKINDVKNDKIKKSLIELTKVFKEK